MPVLVQTVGNPAQGYEIVGSVANPATVLLDGPDEALANILSVVTAPVDIDGATETVNTRTGLQELPPDVRVVNPVDGSVVAVVQIRPRGVTQLLNDLPVTVDRRAAGLHRHGRAADAGRRRLCLGGDDGQSRRRTTSRPRSRPWASAQGRHQVRPSVTVPPEVQWLRTDPEVVVVTLEPARRRRPRRRPNARRPQATPARWVSRTSVEA